MNGTRSLEEICSLTLEERKSRGGRVDSDGAVESRAHSRALALALSPRGNRELWGSGHNGWMSPWGVLGFLDLPTFLSFMD